MFGLTFKGWGSLSLVFCLTVVAPSGWAKGWAVVVEGYSSGALYVEELKSRGYKVAHVQSSRIVPPALASSFKPESYDSLLVLTRDNHDQVVQQLRRLGAKAVFIGTESGVEAGDWVERALAVARKFPGHQLYPS